MSGREVKIRWDDDTSVSKWMKIADLDAEPHPATRQTASAAQGAAPAEPPKAEGSTQIFLSCPHPVALDRRHDCCLIGTVVMPACVCWAGAVEYDSRVSMWIASVQHTTQFTSKTRIVGEPHECRRRLATS